MCVCASRRFPTYYLIHKTDQFAFMKKKNKLIAKAKVQINFHYGKNAMCCVCFPDESYICCILLLVTNNIASEARTRQLNNYRF